MGAMDSTNLDKVIIVNEKNQVIGQMGKDKAHMGKGNLHRAISVFLFNSLGQLLIQKRSIHKIVAAELWANTACGNVRQGETHLECALRRLMEELNIAGVQLKKIGTVRYFYEFNNGYSENEIDTVFVGQFSKKPDFNKKEVSDYEYINWDELLSQLKNDESKYAPWVNILLGDEHISKEINNFIKEL